MFLPALLHLKWLGVSDLTNFFLLFFNSEFNPDVVDILSTPENATQSKTSVSQTEISEENIHHEHVSVSNPFQKEIFTYLVEVFKVSIVSKLIKWRMFIHTKGVEVFCL